MYRIEIWKFYDMLDSYENTDIKEVGHWFRCKWENAWLNNEIGGFYMYENGDEITYSKAVELGFSEEVEYW